MSELTSLQKAVWRHYYGKLSKFTRGGKLSKHLDGYLPGDSNASKLGVLYRGTNKQEVDKLAQGRFRSLWGGQPERQNGVIVKPSRNATWVASNPRMAATYARSEDARMVVVGPSVLRRKDKVLTHQIGASTTTAPIRGGIGQKEVRGLLKGEAFSPQRWNTRGIKKWKPVPLGEIQRKEFSRIDRGRVEMSSAIGYEGGVPLTGKIARDRWVKKLRDEDLDRRDANLGRAGAAGAIAGALFPSKKAGLYARMGAGALAGSLGVLGVRQATKNTRDAYGERSRGAKRAEMIPAAAGLTAAGVLAAKKLGILKKIGNLKFEVSEFSKKEKKGLNPYLGATASGAISGAGLGFIPTILRRGSTLKGALKAGALGGLASGAIVGGGALIGSKILGAPREDEGSAFTKRAAIGGTLAGAGAGLAGGILLRKTRGGARVLVGASKNWRPAQWLRKSPLAGSAAIGAVGGAIYGGATGADEGQQVDSFRHLRKDLRKDVKAAAMRLERKAQIGDVKFQERTLSDGRFQFAQKDWRDARRESRSEAVKDTMIGGGVLAAGAGIGGGAGYFGWRAGNAARSVGNAANEVGATVNSVNSAVRGVTKPRFVRSRQWMKKQMTTFPTFTKVMKKFRLENTEFGMKPVNPELIAALKRSAGEGLMRIGKPTKDMKALLAAERARQPSWNRGVWNKLRNALALERKAKVHSFQLSVNGQYRPELTEEQRRLRNAVAVGAVGVGAAGGVAALGLRSLRRADEAAAPMRAQMAADKEKWANAIAKARDEANARAAFRSDIAKNLKANRAMARKPIEAAAEGARAATKERIAEALHLQKLASVRGGMTRGQRIGAAGALAALRKKYRFETQGKLHRFAVRYRNSEGQSTGFKGWARGDAIFDDQGNPTNMGIGSLMHSANRYSRQGWRTVRRGSGLVQDLREVSQGVKTKKREWEKPYFRNAVATGLGGAGVLAGAFLYRKGGMYGAPKWAKKWRGAVDYGAGALSRAKGSAEDWMNKQFEARFGATVRMFGQDRWRMAGYTGMLTGGPINAWDEIEAERYYRSGGVEYRKRDALKHALPGAAAAIPASIAGYKYSKILAKRGNRLGSLAVRVGAPALAVGIVNSLVGPRKQAVRDRAKRTREFSMDEYNEMRKKHYKDTARKRDYITSNIGSLTQSGLAGTIPGMAIGGLLAGRRGVKPGFFAGIAGGVATRALLQKGINRKEDKWIDEANSGKASNLRQWGNDIKHTAINVGIPVGLVGAGIGIASARKPLFKGAESAARSARKMAKKARARMPVSKATQDARFAKAKPARAWEVGGSQGAPSNWPRLAMESRMNATLQMFEGGYPPFGYQDYYSAPGWDLRDARGRSARVFAPNSKKRVRRPAEWHEKKDNQKKLIAGAGIAAALLAGGGGLLAGRKMERAASVARKAKQASIFSNAADDPAELKKMSDILGKAWRNKSNGSGGEIWNEAKIDTVVFGRGDFAIPELKRIYKSKSLDRMVAPGVAIPSLRKNPKDVQRALNSFWGKTPLSEAKNVMQSTRDFFAGAIKGERLHAREWKRAVKDSGLDDAITKLKNRVKKDRLNQWAVFGHEPKSAYGISRNPSLS